MGGSHALSRLYPFRLADSDNGATALDMTGSDQVIYPAPNALSLIRNMNVTLSSHEIPTPLCWHSAALFAFGSSINQARCFIHLQGAYNSYVAIHTYWSDTTNMDNIRGADITDGTIAGSIESISANVTHTASDLATP